MVQQINWLDHVFFREHQLATNKLDHKVIRKTSHTLQFTTSGEHENVGGFVRIYTKLSDFPRSYIDPSYKLQFAEFFSPPLRAA